MNCPNCDYEMENKDVCPNCELDTTLFIKTGNISNKLYNRGLQALKTLDLSGATDYLKKSLEFNRNNYVARNLLGLICFETGRIGDALRHWIISSSIMRTNNPAKDYIQKLQQQSRVLDKYGDAVKMYNQALYYISLKNDDMAVIQLKKAIELSPKFVDALNLLSFCYLIQKEKDKALSAIEKVLSIDANNQIALNYYHDIFPSKIRPEPIQAQSKKTAPTYIPLAPKDKKSFGNTFHLSEIISFILGGLCAAAVMYILVMPAVIETKDSEIEALSMEKSINEQEANSKAIELEKTITILEGEKESLITENENLKEELSLQEKIQIINRANSIKTSASEEAADILYSLDTSGLPNDVMEMYEGLKAEVYPRVAQQLYNTGMQRYNVRNYEEAKAALEKALLYAAKDAGYTSTIIYYLGRTAEINSDIISARRYYETVIEEYPNSTNASNARSRLAGLS